MENPGSWGLEPSGNIKIQITMLESSLTCDLNCYGAAVYILLELSSVQSSSNKLETDFPDLQFLLCNLPASRVLTKLCYQQMKHKQVC